MNSNNLLLKILAEAVRAATPQGSVANSLASAAKLAATISDAATANTQGQAVHALASLLSEYAYSNSPTERERAALTLGNALLLATEAAQHASTTPQNSQINAPISCALPGSATYDPQQSPYFQHESNILQSEYNRLVQQKKKLEEERKQLFNKLKQQKQELQDIQKEREETLKNLRLQLLKK